MSTKSRKLAKQPTDEANTNGSAKHLAHVALSSEVNAAAIVQTFNVGGPPDVQELVDTLAKHCDAIVRGDTKEIERMLASQAYALNAMFASLARRAKNQERLAPYDAHMKFALRAQSQCRATLETLAAIKNPPNVAFVKQANIANGPQQVNNDSRAQEKENLSSKLLEAPHAKPEWMDATAPGTTSQTDPRLATVATVDRPKDA